LAGPRQVLRGCFGSSHRHLRAPGGALGKFMIKFTYSSGSWARMITSPDDRTTAVRTMLEIVGGSLEQLYWDVESGSAYAIADLPDVLTSAAVMGAAYKTGAFRLVEVHELITSNQMQDVLLLARTASEVYHVPGESAF
jgi:uncharacterized protein with GYD domain